MRCQTLPLCGLAAVATLALCVGLSAQAAPGQQPIVAVFDIEAKGIALAPQALDRLSDFLNNRITATGQFKVVPRSMLRERIAAEKTESYRDCYDTQCQIELGRELAASKWLSAQILKLGNRCTVALDLFELREATSERSAAATGACDEGELAALIEQASRELALPPKPLPQSGTVGATTTTPAVGPQPTQPPAHEVPSSRPASAVTAAGPSPSPPRPIVQGACGGCPPHYPTLYPFLERACASTFTEADLADVRALFQSGRLVRKDIETLFNSYGSRWNHQFTRLVHLNEFFYSPSASGWLPPSCTRALGTISGFGRLPGRDQRFMSALKAIR